MNITRVERDGVEFFTINATGESGMSESGLARLCGVTQQAISKLLQNSVTTKSPSECLEPLFSNDFRLQPSGKIAAQLRGLDNATVIRSEFCSKIIEYYAFESKYKTKEALFAFRKFAEMGIQTWIQGITGWQTEQELAPRRVVRTPLSTSRKNSSQSQLAPQLPPPDAIELDIATIDLLTRETRQGSTYRLYLQLLKLEALEQRPAPMAIAQASNIKHSTFYTSIKHLQNLGLCPDWLEPKPRIGLEKSIRDRLHQELGGQVEAPTKFGPVDLLTATELIEVKEFPDWKTGLGQLLAKANCYPSHTKRLHLFGKPINLKNIEACCAEFDISVTVESEFLAESF
jgi:transcriptional regulator with XRE-family HTH domain